MPTAFALRQNIPNPFNPTTTIGFDLPRSTTIRLTVYDVGGRLAATLLDGPQPAGRLSCVWDGRDRSGERVPSGIYFARMEAGRYAATRKMTLLW